MIACLSGKDFPINTCSERTHADHDHRHGPGCGHAAVHHDGHTDYLHDGHLHHPHDDHIDEHVIAVSSENPERCTTGRRCGGHEDGPVHGPGCGHETVPHGNHIDYRVGDHLHHPRGGHCDNHGSLRSA